MSQSRSQVVLHMVVRTKDRRRRIDTAIRPRLHAYLAASAGAMANWA